MKRTTDKVFLILSLIFGVIIGIVEEFLLKGQFGHIFNTNRILYVTIYMAIFMFIMGIILIWKGLAGDAFANFGKIIALTLVVAIGFVGCSVLFEFLYELGGNKPKEIKATDIQYVFLVDDSGSMHGNDPTDARYDAVEQIINSLTPTNKFAVYSFENDVNCITPMGSENSTGYTLPRKPFGNGGTNIIEAVKTAVDDVAKRTAHTKIIILTDGEPSDNYMGNFGRAIDKCTKKNASVSSVGFGTANEVFLQEFATKTGGMYVFSDNIDNISLNLDTVVKAQTTTILSKDRDLLSARNDYTSGSVLYAFLRILFLVVLGVLWSIIKLLLIGEKKFTKSAAIASIALCALGAVLLEVLFLTGIINGSITRIIFCVLWACTIIPESAYEAPSLDRGLYSNYGNGMGMNTASDLNSKSREVGGTKSFL